MAKVMVRLSGGDMVVFGKMMYDGETRELDHRQAAQLAAMAPGRVVALGGEFREEALAEEKEGTTKARRTQREEEVVLNITPRSGEESVPTLRVGTSETQPTHSMPPVSVKPGAGKSRRAAKRG